MKRKPLFIILCISVFLLYIPALHAATLQDLEGHWSVNDVNKLITRGSVGGYPDGTFKPDATVTRAEFSKILRQSIGYQTVDGNSFTDTRTHWALSDIQTLVKNQVIIPSEYGKNYGPDSNITRREIAIMLVRAMGLNDSAIASSGEYTGFTDDSNIKSYDKGYLYLARELGLVGGYEDGSFRPNNRATRAEACVMIVRVLNLMGIDTQTPAQPDNNPQENTPAIPSASQKNSCQITLENIQHTNFNTLGEQYVQTDFKLTIPNNTSDRLTVSETNLKAIVTYSSGAQINAKQTSFKTVIEAGKTASIPTSISILLPNNHVAQMVLGNKIIDIQIQLTLNGQTYEFEDISTTLLQNTK